MNGEDLVAGATFGPQHATGRYVDVGCFDPQKWSNTYRFYLSGWSGICIDPNPRFTKLWHSIRPRDRFLNLAISDYVGESRYVDNPDLPHENAIRTGSDSSAAGDAGLTVPVDRLDRILAAYHPAELPIDLMSIDCEGHDLVVLKSNDFERFRPRVLIVEDHRGGERTEIDEFCNRNDYRLVGLTSVSKLFADTRWLAERRQKSASGI